MIARLALIALAVFLAGAALAQGAMADPAPDGASIYGRCSACHTASGAGLPGAFPPLNRDMRMMAAQPAGRRYLALVVRLGLIGALDVEGQTYRNVMPAQSGLEDAAIAAVLNHVGTRISHDGPAFRPFTAAEVAGYTADAGKTSAAELATLHANLAKGGA
jgi:mono/diheme cytochrome c family protein